jgi:pyridoxamine 5'-phosphate oxidase
MSQEPDPFKRFEGLFAKAWEVGIKNAHAMTLSTVASDGQPSSRQVLLKGIDERGFVFYTNFNSRKGSELEANPRCSLNFYWREMDQQVTILGSVEEVSPEEADAYFESRDRGSQLSAWASAQSEVLSSKAKLVAEVVQVEVRYPGKIPRPPNWSGYRVVPFYFDFWTSGEFRLHDRFRYRLVESEWKIDRLYP